MNCSTHELYSVLQQYDKIVVTAHVSPDGDAIGSCLAVYGWLRAIGKDAFIVLDDDVDTKFNFLQDYKAILKPGDIQTDESWLMVVLDATDMQRIGAVADMPVHKILNIDHHISNQHFADWEYVRPDCAAAGEILTALFDEWHVAIEPAWAEALYMAIATDCGFFKFSNTTGHTLRMAARLVDAGAKPNRVSEHLEARSIEKLRALSEVLHHIELFHSNTIAGLAFTPSLLKITGEHTGSFIDYVRTIRGVDVAFTVKYMGENETRVSLRSKKADVNAIAAVFGGGGHVRAAGCTIAAPLEEAKRMVVKEIEKVL